MDSVFSFRDKLDLCRRFVNKFIVKTTLLIIIVSLLIFPVHQVSAASVHDDTIDSVSQLSIVDPVDNCTVDLTDTWASDFRGFLSGSNLSSFDNRTGWGVSLVYADDGYGLLPTTAYVYWWNGSSPVSANFFSNAYQNDLRATAAGWGFLSTDWDSCALTGGVFSSSATVSIAAQKTDPIFFIKPHLFLNIDVNYPQDYEGEGLPLLSKVTDTDGDGLTNYVESPYYPGRDSIFCNLGTSLCAYPDPNKKDLYVEIDWLDDGLIDYQPTNTQLSLVSEMFEDRDINVHFDTGQYGGGNGVNLPVSNSGVANLLRDVKSGLLDYYDVRNGGDSTSTGGAPIDAQFSSQRNNIWRYMFFGHKWSFVNSNNQIENTESTGWAQVLGVNSFISAKALENSAPNVVSPNRLVANTIAHELGHMLCLSDVQVFSEQPLSCVFAGIDNNDDTSSHYNLENYESVMNYRYQLTNIDDLGVVKYSHGANSTSDHNDWEGVNNGMGLFSVPLTPFSDGAHRSVANPTYERPYADEPVLN